MTIARALQGYLERKGTPYELVPHPRAPSSTRTAEAAGVSGHQLAKAVVTEDASHYVAVVVPASRRVQLGVVREYLGRQCGLATEQEVARIFDDCSPGAVPAIAQPYGLEMLVDESLLALDDVYFEAGDHQSLVHVAGGDFRALVRGCVHGDFAGD